MKLITERQIRLIHALKNALGLEDTDYRSVLWTRFGVLSCKLLDQDAAGCLIEEMEEVAVKAGVWESREDKRQRFNDLRGRKGDFASPEQLRFIEALWEEASRIPESARRKRGLRTFLEKVAKASDIRFLNRDGAGKVINALEAMKGKKKAGKRKKAV